MGRHNGSWEVNNFAARKNRDFCRMVVHSGHKTPRIAQLDKDPATQSSQAQNIVLRGVPNVCHGYFSFPIGFTTGFLQARSIQRRFHMASGKGVHRTAGCHRLLGSAQRSMHPPHSTHLELGEASRSFEFSRTTLSWDACTCMPEDA